MYPRRMLRKVHGAWWAVTSVALGMLVGCNLITGVNDLQIEDANPSGQGGSGGASGPSSGPGSGVGGGAGGAGGVVTTGSGGDVCGDGVCGMTESCQSCDADCGACPPTCGNGTCDASETCNNCPADCGTCNNCGDGTCSAPETCSTCPADCGMCPICDGAGPATTPLDAEEQSFLSILNNYRAQNGLGALSACTSLNRAAQGHSEDMRDQNYFSHTGLDGSSPWQRSCDACYDLGCGPQTAMAENIAAGNSTGQSTFTQWQNSPGHNANMLGSAFKVIGIGRATGGGQYGVYWTTVFGGATEASCN